jgi:hypothetical protein
MPLIRLLRALWLRPACLLTGGEVLTPLPLSSAAGSLKHCPAAEHIQQAVLQTALIPGVIQAPEARQPDFAAHPGRRPRAATIGPVS